MQVMLNIQIEQDIIKHEITRFCTPVHRSPGNGLYDYAIHAIQCYTNFVSLSTQEETKEFILPSVILFQKHLV